MLETTLTRIRCRPEIKWTIKEGKQLSTQLLTGASWSLLATGLAQGLTVAISMIVARFLGDHGYGQFSLIQNAINSFSQLGSFGIGLTATKYIAEFRKTDGERTGKVIGFSLLSTSIFGSVAAFVLYCLAPRIANAMMGVPELGTDLRLAAVALFFSILINTQTGVLAGFEAFKLTAKLNYIRALLSLPIIAGAVMLYGLRGAIVGMMLAGAAGWAINSRAITSVCSHNGMRPLVSKHTGDYSMLWKFSVPALVACALPGTCIWLANSIVARQPAGYAEVAYVNAAYQLRSALLLVPATIGAACTPLISAANAAGDAAGLRRTFRTAIITSVAATIIGIVPMLVFSHRLMGLYGADFSGKAVVLRIMVIGAGILAVQLPIGNLIAGMGQMWVGVMINLLWAAVILISTSVLTARGHGAIGAAIAHLVAYSLHLVSNSLYAARLLSRAGTGLPPRADSVG